MNIGLGTLLPIIGILAGLGGKKGGGIGSLLPPGVNLETLETTDYQGDPTKYKVFVDSKTGKFYGTEEERDEATKKMAQVGLMALFNLGGKYLLTGLQSCSGIKL